MEKLSIYSEKKVNLTSSSFFAVFVFLFWAKDTVLAFVIVAISRIPGIGIISPFVAPCLFIVSIMLALPFILRNVYPRDLVFVCCIALTVLLSIVFFQKNSVYINEQLWNILGLSIPLYFIGLSFNYRVVKKALYYASIFGIIAMFMYQIYCLSLGRELNTDNMFAAYNVLPSVLFLFCRSFEKNKIYDWILSLIGFVLLFVFGTRGPVLACAIFLIVNIFLKIFTEKSVFKRCFFILICLAVLIVLFVGNNMHNIIKSISAKFEEIGFSTRFFDHFLQGNLSESNGRAVLQGKIWEAIKENPLGYGCMGDRPIIDTYCHNIILEMLCSYGIVFGSVILIGLAILIVLGIKRSRGTDLFHPLILFTVMVLTKLMLSGSYISEPYFFLLIGLCVRSIRQTKRGVNS